MPPQFFHNNAGERLEQLPGERLGPYFSGLYAGRAVARLDWNRDGRDDVCITHVDAPVALLENDSANAGRSLGVRLRGIASSRDAIGTTVRIETASRTQTQQLTAGDGFQACNERRLIFGLGEETQVRRLSVVWPSGIEQAFENLPAATDLLIVEGSEPIRLDRIR
jgi:hypothetical protein